MKLDYAGVILSPVITEKATGQRKENTYAFRVEPHARKPLIRAAVEKLFKVRVLAVNTAQVSGKVRGSLRGIKGRTGRYKKAWVKLAPGQKIELLEGIS